MKKLIPWLIAAIVLQLCIYLYLNHLLAPSVAGGYTLTPTGSSSVQAASSNVLIRRQFPGRRLQGRGEGLLYQRRQPEERRSTSAPRRSSPTSPGCRTATSPWRGSASRANWVPSAPWSRSTWSPTATSIKPTITGLSKDAEIADVAYSTETNVIYIQVKSGDISTIYRTDANNVLTKVGNTPPRHRPDRQFKKRGRPALRQRQHRAGLPGGQERETVDLSP